MGDVTLKFKKRIIDNALLGVIHPARLFRVVNAAAVVHEALVARWAATAPDFPHDVHLASLHPIPDSLDLFALVSEIVWPEPEPKTLSLHTRACTDEQLKNSVLLLGRRLVMLHDADGEDD